MSLAEATVQPGTAHNDDMPTKTISLALGLGLGGGSVLLTAAIVLLVLWRNKQKSSSPQAYRQGKYAQITTEKGEQSATNRGTTRPRSNSYQLYDGFNSKDSSKRQSEYFSPNANSDRDVENGDGHCHCESSHIVSLRSSLLSTRAATPSDYWLPAPKPALHSGDLLLQISKSSPQLVFSPPTPIMEENPPAIPRKSSRRDSSGSRTPPTSGTPLPTPALPRKSSRRTSSPGSQPSFPSSRTSHVDDVHLQPEPLPRSCSINSSVYSASVHLHQNVNVYQQDLQSSDTVCFTHFDLQALNDIQPMPTPDSLDSPSSYLGRFPSPPVSPQPSVRRPSPMLRLNHTPNRSIGMSPVISPMSSPDRHTYQIQAFPPSTPPTPPPMSYELDAMVYVGDDDDAMVSDDEHAEEHGRMLQRAISASKPLRFNSTSAQKQNEESRPLRSVDSALTL